VSDYRPHLQLPAILQATNINSLRYDFLYIQRPSLSVPSKAPDDSNRLERGTAMALRCFLFLLLAYIIFHKIFPFSLFRARLADMTGADFLFFILRSLIATAGAAYLAIKGFIQPDMQHRDRVWCERWTALAFGVITIAVGSILITLLERNGIIVITAYWVASCILWLLF
jgi:hypothetical protein